MSDRETDWLSEEEMEKIYGYSGHRCVLYANSKGEIIPGDLIWFHTDPNDYTVDGHKFEDMRPVAVVISHSSDKYYRDNLAQALLIPSSWSYEVVWRDEDWFEKNKRVLVRYLGWQDGMRGGVTTPSEYIETDEAEYNAGFFEGERRKSALERK